MSALPLILGGAALLLLSGKKKKKTTTTNGTTDDTVDDTADDTDDTDDTSDDTEDEGYGKVASGVRQDHIGAHPWRITFEEDGYHALLTMGSQNSAPVAEEIGVAASIGTAKELLRDHFNQALLDAGRTEDDFRDDPVVPRITGLASGSKAVDL